MTYAKTAELNGRTTISRNKEHSASTLKKPTFTELFWVFIIASILGLAAEVIVSYFFDGRWESRAGLVWGPFSPIYGLGAMLITFALWRMEKHPVQLFLGSALLGAAFEYAVGWFCETFYGIVAWSYVNQPFNFGGHTSLLLAVIWGFAGLVWFTIAWPLIRKGVNAIPYRPRKAATAVMCVFIVVDVLVTFAAFDCWFDRQAGLPIETPKQQLCATYFNDEFMSTRFETMSMWTSLAYNRIER